MALLPVRGDGQSAIVRTSGAREADATDWGASPADDPELRFGHFWMVARRHWFLIILSLAIPVGGAVAYVKFRTPVYESSTMIRIAGTPVGVTNVVAAPASDAVSTEMAVLGSQTLAAQAVDDAALRLDLQAPQRVPRSSLISGIAIAKTADTGSVVLLREPDGRFLLTAGSAATQQPGPFAIGDTIRFSGAKFTLLPEAAQYPLIRLELHSPNTALLRFQRTLKVVRPIREADVILVKYRGTDAALTQQVLASLSSHFMSWRQDVMTADARSRATVLREEIDTLSLRLRSADDELRAFQQSQQVIDPETEASTDVTQLAQMEADRGSIEAERSALSQMLQQAYTASAVAKPGDPSPFTTLMAFPTLLRIPSTSELLGALATAHDERAQLLGRRTLQDPDVQVLTSHIHEIEDQLRAAVITYANGLTQQEAALDTSIATFNKQLHDVPKRTIQYAELDRKPKALSDLYAILQQQLKEAEVGQAAVDPTVQLVDAAVTAAAPVSPKPLLDGCIGIILGVMLAIGVVFMREQLDPFVHTRADVQRLLSVPVLGLVPHLRLRRRSRPLFAGRRSWTDLLVEETGALGHSNGNSVVASHPAPRIVPALADDPRSRAQAAEAFARLHTNIQFLQRGVVVKTLVVTSAMAEDGKTTSSTNLALAIAQRGKRVLLIDADLRRGSVHASFGISRVPGLSTLLSDGHTLDQVTGVFEIAGGVGAIHVLPSGPLSNSPAMLLASDRMRELVREAETAFDVVVIDSPPINAVSDAAILSGLAQGVVVVVRAGVTARGALAYAAEQLRMVGAPIVGTVLNDVDFRRDAMYDATYRYYGSPDLYHVTPADVAAVRVP